MTPKVQLALWIAHPLLQLSVAAVMFYRKSHKVFPVFFAYLISQILMFSVLFPVFQSEYSEIYFYAYWSCAAISLAIGFKVIHEIFLDIFRPYHTLKDLGSVLFQWAALVMLLVAGVVAAASPVAAQGPLVQAVLTVQRCVRVIQCGLILFLLVFSKYLGVTWRQHSFGIALGFGSFASAELTLLALYASSHISQGSLSLFNMVAYNGAIFIWLVYAWIKTPARDASTSLLMSQRWDQGLTDLQHPVSSDSLIPLFEGMVDRAFSRTNGDSASDPAAAEELTAESISSSRSSQRAPRK
jgi:hypothetical protein